MSSKKRQNFYCVGCGAEIYRVRMTESGQAELECPKCKLVYRAQIPHPTDDHDAYLEMLMGNGDFEVLLDNSENDTGPTDILCIFCSKRGGAKSYLEKKQRLVSSDESVTYYQCMNSKCKRSFEIKSY